MGGGWRAETGIFLVLWLYISWLAQTQFLLDPGVYWSTVLGQRILTEGDVPRAETFSCTLAGQPWNSHQWLAQVGMALLHAVGGIESIVFAAVVLLAGLYTWVAHRLMRAGFHWTVAMLIVLLTVMASRYHMLARPHLTTIALLGWTFAQLVDFEAGKCSVRRLFWLLPVFVLWTNLHGGALGGLATLTLVILGWLAAWPLGLNSPIRDGRTTAALLVLLVGSWLATLVNPYGWQLPREWFALMGSPVLPQHIEEHKPLDWRNPFQLPVIAFGLLYLLALANLASWRQLRVTWLLPLIWLVLTIQRIRHCTLCSITIAVALAEVLPRTRLAAALAELGSPLFRPAPTETIATTPRIAGVKALVLPAVLVVGGLVVQAHGWQVPYLGRGWLHVDPGLFPVELLPLIEQHSQPGDAIFNDLAYGGFLIYHAPQLRIFLDDRCELYGDRFLTMYFDANTAYREASQEDLPQLDQLERWADQYGFRLALVMKTSGFDRYLASQPEHWTKLGETEGRYLRALVPGAVLYERQAK